VIDFTTTFSCSTTECCASLLTPFLFSLAAIVVFNAWPLRFLALYHYCCSPPYFVPSPFCVLLVTNCLLRLLSADIDLRILPSLKLPPRAVMHRSFLFFFLPCNALCYVPATVSPSGITFPFHPSRQPCPALQPCRRYALVFLGFLMAPSPHLRLTFLLAFFPPRCAILPSEQTLTTLPISQPVRDLSSFPIPLPPPPLSLSTHALSRPVLFCIPAISSSPFGGLAD